MPLIHRRPWGSETLAACLDRYSDFCSGAWRSAGASRGPPALARTGGTYIRGAEHSFIGLARIPHDRIRPQEQPPFRRYDPVAPVAKPVAVCRKRNRGVGREKVGDYHIGCS